jgi:ferrous iron transport protein B
VFLRRAGTIILTVTLALWLLASYPVAPEGEKQSEYSIAGRIASVLEVGLAPIGFNHEMSLAVIPAMAAREVASPRSRPSTRSMRRMRRRARRARARR